MHCTKSCKSTSGGFSAHPVIYSYHLLQRYGLDGGVPWSVLAFCLEMGEDLKKCLAVRLKGEFIRDAFYKNVNVKVSCGTLKLLAF